MTKKLRQKDLIGHRILLSRDLDMIPCPNFICNIQQENMANKTDLSLIFRRKNKIKPMNKFLLGAPTKNIYENKKVQLYSTKRNHI